MNSECGNCKYWATFKGEKTKGQCRRYTPEVIASTSGGGFLTCFGIATTAKTEWPRTEYDDWCGEHELKPEPEKK